MTQPDNTLQVTTPFDQEVVMIRAFDAPCGLVFRAWTEPEHVRHWWGSTMLLCEADVRPGGSWRYVTTARDGTEVPFTGVYQEVAPPERVVHTEIYDVESFNRGDPAVTTISFTEQDRKTLVTQTTIYPSKEIRDFVLQSGMEAGAAESLDRLAKLLKTLT